MTLSIGDMIESAERLVEAQSYLERKRAAWQRYRQVRQYPVREPEAERRRVDGLRQAGTDGRLVSSWSRIRMVVSPWYADLADPPGIMTRTIRAAD